MSWFEQWQNVPHQDGQRCPNYGSSRRRMLHGCHKFLKECHILLNDDLRLMRSMLLPLKSELILCFKTTVFFKRAACFSLQNLPYLLMRQGRQGTLSGRCSTAWGQNDISCQWIVRFPLVHGSYKETCCIEATTILSFEHGATGQKWIPFLFDIHWPNTIFYSKHGCIAAYSYQTAFPSWLTTGLHTTYQNRTPTQTWTRGDIQLGFPVNMHRLLVKSVLSSIPHCWLKKSPEISTF